MKEKEKPKLGSQISCYWKRMNHKPFKFKSKTSKRPVQPKIPPKRKTNLVLILTSILIKTSLSNPKCVVDQCKRCRYVNVDTCDVCESGYYKRTFFGPEKQRNFNACWSIMKLLLGLLAALLMALCYLGLCYYAWWKGRQITRIVDSKKPDKVIKDQRKFGSKSPSKPKTPHIATPPPTTQRSLNIPASPPPPQAPPPQYNQPQYPQQPLPAYPPPQQNYPYQYPPPQQQPYYPPPRPAPAPMTSYPMRQSVVSPPRLSRKPSITIIRERPTTIVRESPVPKRATPKMSRRPSAKILRYEPEEIRNMSIAESPYASPSRLRGSNYSTMRRLY